MEANLLSLSKQQMDTGDRKKRINTTLLFTRHTESPQNTKKKKKRKNYRRTFKSKHRAKSLI